MVSVEFREGIVEILDILKHMEKKYRDKLPSKLIEFMEKNKSTSYISNLDHSKKINEMNLKEKTKDILAVLYIKYWCTPQEKSEFGILLNKNEIKYQENLRRKYNVDNIFEKKVQCSDTEDINSVAMVEFKQSFFTRFVNKIKNFFNAN